jgi:hypothetical protein
MNTHYLVSLCSVNSNIDFEEFQHKCSELLNKTLMSWIEDPLTEIELNLELSKEYHSYFIKLSQFREKLSIAIMNNHGFMNKKNCEDNNDKFILFFDIDKIGEEFHGEAYSQKKFQDVLQIIEELTVKFKSFNYLDSLTFLFEHECNKLPEEMKKWNEIVRGMFKEKSFIVIE